MNMGSLPSLPALFPKSRRSHVVRVLVGASLLGAGMLLPPGDVRLAGWCVVGLFTAAEALQLLPSFSGLHLTEEGFRFRRGLLCTRHDWSAVRGFGVSEGSRGRLRVGFNLRSRDLPGCLGSYHCHLPDSYGRTPEDLARVLSLHQTHFSPSPVDRVR